jgi:hypothetical protein
MAPGPPRSRRWTFSTLAPATHSPAIIRSISTARHARIPSHSQTLAAHISTGRSSFPTACPPPVQLPKKPFSGPTKPFSPSRESRRKRSPAQHRRHWSNDEVRSCWRLSTFCTESIAERVCLRCEDTPWSVNAETGVNFPGTLSRPRTLIALVDPKAAFRCKTPSCSPAVWSSPWP